MDKTKKYLIWLIITLGYGLTIGVLENSHGVFSRAGEAGGYICWALYAVFAFGVYIALLRCIKNDNNFARLKFLTELAPALGILGTAVGMTWTLYQGWEAGITVGDQDSLKVFWDILFHGTAVAFLTTITGLVVAISLSSYEFVLKDYTK